MKKTIRLLARITVYGSLALILALLLVNQWPQWLINTFTLRIASGYLRDYQQIDFRWAIVHVEAKSVSFFVKRFSFQWDSPCVRLASPSVEGCAAYLNLNLEWDWRRGLPKNNASLPNEVDIDLGESQFKLSSEGSTRTIAGNLDLHFARPFFWQARSEILVDGQHQASLKLKSRGEERTGIFYDLTANYHHATDGNSPQVALQASGTKTFEEFLIRLRSRVTNLSPWTPKLSTEDCQIRLAHSGDQESASVTCPTELTLKLPERTARALRPWLKPTGIVFSADLKRKRTKPDSPVNGEMKLEVAHLFGPMKQGSASIVLTPGGTLSSFPQGLNFVGRGSLEIAHFERWVAALAGTTLEIPAPFNQLKGPILGEATTTPFHLGALPKIQYRLVTKLASEGQRVDTETNGEWFEQKHRAEIALSRVELTLPEIDLKNPPPLTVDDRFRPLEVRDRDLAAGLGQDYEISIVTPVKSPVRVRSVQLPKPIPVRVNVHFKKNRGATGKISVDTFPFEILRRKAQVEYFEVIAATQKSETEVKGRVNFFYTDYTISLFIDGLLDRPRTRIVSSPPLPEPQAMAVLLFGKEPKQLNQEELASVGNTTAALTDSAIGLASMYALAATPIESVGYDTNTRQFSARLRLADGTSFNVKSDLNEVKQLGIRKRLGPNWGLRSYVEDPFEAVKRSVTTLLEWHFAY